MLLKGILMMTVGICGIVLTVTLIFKFIINSSRSEFNNSQEILDNSSYDSNLTLFQTNSDINHHIQSDHNIESIKILPEMSEVESTVLLNVFSQDKDIEEKRGEAYHN